MAGATPDNGMSGLTLAGVDAYDDYLSKQPPPAPPQPGFLSRTTSDLAKSVEKGALEIPGALTGLLDVPAAILTGERPISDAADAVGAYTGFQPSKTAAAIKFSPQHDASGQAVADMWKDPNASLLDVAGAYAANPLYTADQVAGSLPVLAAGGILGKSVGAVGEVAAKAADATTGAAATEAVPGTLLRTLGPKGAASVEAGANIGAVTTGQQMDQYQGPDQARNALAALGAGAGTALLGGTIGEIAQKLHLETPQTLIAKIGDTAAPEAAPALLATRTGRVAAGSVVGAAQGGAQGAVAGMASNYGNNKPVMAGIPQQATEGALMGGIMGAGANLVAAAPPTPETPPAPVADAAAPPPAPPIGPVTAALASMPIKNEGLVAQLAARRAALQQTAQAVADGKTPPVEPAGTIAPVDEPVSAGTIGATAGTPGIAPGAVPNAPEAAPGPLEAAAADMTPNAAPNTVEQPGDIYTPSGDPFTTRVAARLAAQQAGAAFEPVQIGDGEYVVRAIAPAAEAAPAEAPIPTEITPPAAELAAPAPAVAADNTAAAPRTKETWLKAVADGNRLNGGILSQAENGMLAVSGDPRSTPAGRGLMATVDEAVKAGATIQEVAAAAAKGMADKGNEPVAQAPLTSSGRTEGDRTFLRKQLPDMTDAELVQAQSMYPADHPRQAKILKQIAKRAESSTQGETSEPTSDQAITPATQPEAQGTAAQAVEPGRPGPLGGATNNLVLRQENARQRFLDHVTEHFGLSPEQAHDALNALAGTGLVQLDPMSGQFEVKHGDVMTPEVLARAAEEGHNQGKWHAMSPQDRENALTDAGYATNTGALNFVGKRLLAREWTKLPGNAVEKIKAVWDAAPTTGNLTSTPEEQRAAFQKEAAKRAAGAARLRAQAYAANPFRAFLGKHGIKTELANEFAPDKESRGKTLVRGYGPMFRRDGLNLDVLAQRAVEDGFLHTEDATKLHAMIVRALGGERIAPDFKGEESEAEMKAKMEAAQGEPPPDLADSLEADGKEPTPPADAQAESDAVDDTHEADTATIFNALEDGLDAKSNTSMEDFLRAMGASEQEIKDEIANEAARAQKSNQDGRQPDEASSGAADAGAGERTQQAGAGSAAGAEERLTEPTEADALKMGLGDFTAQAHKLIAMPGGSWVLLDGRRASYENGQFNVAFSWGNGKWSSGNTSDTPARAYQDALKTWVQRGNKPEDFKPADKSVFLSGAQGPDLLTAPTPAEVLAQQDQAAKGEKDKAKADAAATKAEKDAADKKEIDARQQASADNFQLGQSAEDSLSGQKDVFSQPEPKAPVSENTIFTKEAADAARIRLKAKLGRLSSGIDPEMLMDGITLAGYHIERGARTFSAFAKAMIADLGDAVKPHLKSWYMAAKFEPRAKDIKGFDSAGYVEDFEDANMGSDVTAGNWWSRIGNKQRGAVLEELGIRDQAPGSGALNSVSHDNREKIEAYYKKMSEGPEGAEPKTPDMVAKAATLPEHFYKAIADGKMPKDNPALRKMVEAYDGKPVDNARLKEGQEALEAAIAHTARDIVAQGKSDEATFDALKKLYDSQPNLNVRTTTSIENQAYSTPAPLAFLASRLAHITKDSTVLEPTAGTGMLLMGADPNKTITNELNPDRAALLKEQGFRPTMKDAAAAPVTGLKVDSVIANPPFGSTKGADGHTVKILVDGYRLGQVDHVIAANALDSMKDDGHAALILGANKVAGGQSTDDRIFMNWLYSHYNVTSQFEVNGDLYSRQGAGWPVRVITIDGRKASEKVAPLEGTIPRADNWDQVYEQYRNSLVSSGETLPGGKARPVGTLPNETEAGRLSGNDAGQTQGTDSGGRPIGPRTAGGTTDGVVPRVGNDRAGAGETVAEPDNGVGRNENPDGKNQLEPSGAHSATGADNTGRSAGQSAVGEGSNDFQATYEARSARKDEGILTPVNMVEPTQHALSALEDEVGNIDEYAADELGYKSIAEMHKGLMGLQVDAVASAIHQMKKGNGVIIADQTGVGKGRQAAAILRWALKEGHIPVFISKIPTLFTDMYGDLHDIGTDNLKPFLMNRGEWITGDDGEKLFMGRADGQAKLLEGIRDNGTLPKGSNAMFLTYSQINKDNLQRAALMRIAPHAVFVLDESHNAAGNSQTGEFMTKALAESKGVTYLSATYAKRPDNMPLYFKTDIGKAISDKTGLMDAMKTGGLPLQTVVSNNLVKAGQMFRRERSYNGVSVETKVDTANRARHEKQSDAATEALRAIVDADRAFHTTYIAAAKEDAKQEGQSVSGAGNQAAQSVDHTQFSSVVHNFVRQMLLGLKAQTAADEAIKALKAGKKPLIAVDNTMGSFLDAYAGENRIKQGEPLGDFTYRSVLSRALDRTLYKTVQGKKGNKERVKVSLSELDPQTRAAYRHAQDIIDHLDLNIPVSPIDWIRNEIQKAGYNTAEFTGRTNAVDYSGKQPTLSMVPRNEKNDRVATTRAFNSGKLDSIILNSSGSTGISLHASKNFQDQRPRHMIVAQAAQDINTFMQMLGRIHRTGQTTLPSYDLLNVDLPAEKRPTAVLSGKMKSLNANTSSNTESSTSVRAPDFLNKYGDQIVDQYLTENPHLARSLDLDEDLTDPSTPGAAPMDDIARTATGRLALQPVEVQHAFYNDVETAYRNLIDYLDETNQNELTPKTHDFDAKLLAREILHQGTDPSTPFGQDAHYGEYSIKAQGKAMTPEEINSTMQENLAGRQGPAHAQDLTNQLLKTYADQLNENTGRGDVAKYTATIRRIFGEQPGGTGETLINLAKEAAVRGDKAEPITPKQVANAQGVFTGADFIRRHPIGSMWRVEIGGDPYNAIITNIRSTHKENGNPFSLSKINLDVALNGSLRSIRVPATQFHRIEVSSVSRHLDMRQLFKEKPNTDRETAKIITGNLLGAYGELHGGRGSIINFTKEGGATEQGILLPKQFSMGKDARGDYRLESGADALKFLTKSKSPNIGQFGIMSRDSAVRVIPDGDGGIKIMVPKSKARGGAYFLNRDITEHSGEFVSEGSSMVAKPANPTEAAAALDVLMKKQALYALPSMADEARQITGHPLPKAGLDLSAATDAAGAKDIPGFKAAEPADQALTDKLNGIVKSSLPDSGATLRAVQPDEANSTPAQLDAQRAAEGAAQEFGQKVVWVANDGRPLFNGAVSKHIPGAIFLRADSPRPYMAVLGHELLHQMRKTNPDIYDALAARLTKLMTPTAQFDYFNKLDQRYAGRGLKLPKSWDEEQHGDTVGDNFMDPKFWQQLAGTTPGLFKRIGAKVLGFLDKVIAAATGKKPFGSDSFFHDVNAARDAVVSAMGEYRDRVNAGEPSEPSPAVEIPTPAETKPLTVENMNAPEGPLTPEKAEDQSDVHYSLATSAGRALTTNKLVDAVHDYLDVPGKVSWWHKSLGTMYNLAQSDRDFKPVFETAQNFINDVSYYATEAANMAPRLLPKLEGWKDILKKPIDPADNKAIQAPIFQGTLSYGRDEDGVLTHIEDLQAAYDSAQEKDASDKASLKAEYADMSTQDKAQLLLQKRLVSEDDLKKWQGSPIEDYESAVNGRFNATIGKGEAFSAKTPKAGVVFTDAELKSEFHLTDQQIGLYREFRDSTNKSIDDTAKSDMLRFAGEDAAPLRDQIMAIPKAKDAAQVLHDYLQSMAKEDPNRADELAATAEGVRERGNKAQELQDDGYAPLSRFGKYTVDVMADGKREYFGLFETPHAANEMAKAMKTEYGEDAVKQGTLSQEEYRTLAGVTPETLELFGNALGLDSDGESAADKVFQQYIKLTKTNRSAMRRLLHRQGIAGYSEDVGRVLANFVYSNSRSTSAALHIGDLGRAVTAIPQKKGQLKDVAIKLSEYVKNPQQEGQAARAMLFSQYLGGSVASALVNMTQPFATSFPYLSQFGGAMQSGREMLKAYKDVATKGTVFEAGLKAALTHAEETGIVSPQEVHQLMAQARGAGALRIGDGTRAGDAAAGARNAMSRLGLAWGKVFGVAEQLNRRTTFIAAYRIAEAQGMKDPAAFAEKAVNETQFIYSKANKMQWGRGAIGGTLMTFKSYTISYLELLHRMYTQGGPEGKKAAVLGVGMLFLMGGASGLPFEQNIEDLADGALERMGYNTSVAKWKQGLFTDMFGEAGGAFVNSGLSGLPGMPIDVSGRLGMGQIIPGTGLFKQRADHTSDVLDIVGPAGDLAKRVVQGGSQILSGNVLSGLNTMAPQAVRNATQGIDMADTGAYRDANGYTVLQTTPLEAAMKAIGFQPASVANVQQSNVINQTEKGFYALQAQAIRAKWADGIFTHDAAKVAEARADLAAWNAKNPDQPMLANVPAIMRKVQQMGMSKAQRIAATGPLAMRRQMRADILARNADQQ